MLIADQLDFDVARIDDELFNEHPVVAERGFGFRAGEAKAFQHFLAVVGDPHALAAAPGRGLHHHRITYLLGNLDGMFLVLDFAHVARNGRNLGGRCRFLGFDFVAHGCDRPGVGPNEHKPGLLECNRERLAL